MLQYNTKDSVSIRDTVVKTNSVLFTPGPQSKTLMKSGAMTPLNARLPRTNLNKGKGHLVMQSSFSKNQTSEIYG
jgi:hypothetical protein